MNVTKFKKQKKSTNVNFVKTPYDEELIFNAETFLTQVKLVEHFNEKDVNIAYDDLLKTMDDLLDYSYELRKK